MKIAFLTAEFPALSETFVLNHVTGLVDRGHDVEIFADAGRAGSNLHREVEAYGLRAKTHYWPRMGESRTRRMAGVFARGAAGLAKRPALLAPAVRILRMHRSTAFFSKAWVLSAAFSLSRPRSFDVLHGQFGPDDIKAMVLREAGMLQAALIASFKGHDLSAFVREHGEAVYRPLFRRADHLVTVSESMRRRLVEMGCAERKTSVLRTGVDLQRFTFVERRRKPDEPFRLISVARFIEKKGLEYGIRAVAALERNLRIDYTIVGDGPLRIDLENRIGELQAGASVHLVGTKAPDEVAGLYATMDGMLVPSVTGRDGEQEGIPHAMKEAMATGLPVVASRHAGIDEVVEDGVSGFLVPERDIEAIAARLRTLAENAEQRQAMGRAARQCIEREHDLERINDQLVDLYSRVAHIRKEPEKRVS